MGAHCTRQDGVELAVSGHGRELLKRQPTSVCIVPVHLPHLNHCIVGTGLSPHFRNHVAGSMAVPTVHGTICARSYDTQALRHYSTLHFTSLHNTTHKGLGATVNTTAASTLHIAAHTRAQWGGWGSGHHHTQPAADDHHVVAPLHCCCRAASMLTRCPRATPSVPTQGTIKCLAVAFDAAIGPARGGAGTGCTARQ